MSATKRVVRAARSGSHSWTKEEIMVVIDLWETSTVEEIAERLGMNIPQILYRAWTLRKAGWPLSQKHKRGKFQNLVLELAAERGVKLNKA